MAGRLRDAAGERHFRLALALVVVALLAAATSIIAGRDHPVRGDRGQLTEALGGSAEGASKPAGPSSAGEPQPTGAAAELQALAAKGRSQTFEARYAGSTGSGTPTSSLHVWRTPDSLRQDASTGSDPDSRVLVTKAVVVNCVRPAGQTWTCNARPPATAVGADSLGVPSAGQLAGRTVTARDDAIAGRPVRCFAFGASADAPNEMCLSGDGIVLRVVIGASRLDLVELTLAPVPTAIFEPPAPPIS
jgi:hypothetical protein